MAAWCAARQLVSMIGLSFLALALASVQWILLGCSLSFGADIGGAIRGLDYLALSSVGLGEAPLLYRVGLGPWTRAVTPGHCTVGEASGGDVATGIFAISPAGSAGLLQGSFHQFGVQILTAGVSVAYAFTVTYALARLVDSFMGLRVTEDEEYAGLDTSQHGEKAYAEGGGGE